jgi:hypothetical protein
MNITDFIPAKPRITHRIVNDLDRLQKEFRRQQGRYPQHVAIYLGLDDGRNISRCLFDGGLPTQLLLQVDTTRYDIAAAREHERQILQQRLRVEANAWRIRSIISRCRYGTETIAPLLNMDVEELRRIIDRPEVVIR